jgi:hypothetical protein
MGLLRLFAVVPLTCTVEPTLTLEPVVVNVATNAITFVPYGTVTAMVFAFSSIAPVAAGLTNEKAVMALALESGVSPPSPWRWTADDQECGDCQHKC